MGLVRHFENKIGERSRSFLAFVSALPCRIRNRVLRTPRPPIGRRGKVFPEDEKRPRVLLLATNSIDYDTRVKKTAAALRQEGYAVGILGIAKANAVHQYEDPGLTRATFQPATYQLFFRRELRGLARIATEKEQYAAALKRITMAATESRKFVAGHDELLADLASKRTLLSKLLLLLRQYKTIRPHVKLIARADRQKALYSSAYARWNAEKAYFRQRIERKRIIFDRRYRPVGNHFDFYRSLVGRIHEFAPDIIHANDLLTLPAAIRYRQKKAPHVRVIYDAHELEMHRNKTYNFARNIADQIVEWHYIRKADHVLTVSEGIADILSTSYKIAKPAVVLNSPLAVPTDVGEVIGLKDRIQVDRKSVVIVYTGIVAVGRGLELLIKSLMHLPRDHHVAILGPRRPDKDASLTALASKKGVLDRVHLVHPARPEEVASVIADAELAICPLQNVSLSYDLALPNKLFDAVLAQVPLLVSDLREMRRFVETTGAGISRPMTDHRKMAAAIREALELRSQAYFASVDWAGIARAYGWEAQVDKLLAVYKKVGA
jgi:glycosyltransferase involved in cell wall biosynthesis